MPSNPKKNLFDYATKELSQDAFLRWLIESADDPAVSSVSKQFLGWLTGMTGEIRVVRTDAQWHHMDIVAELDCSGIKVLLVIEDKVGSEEHNQLLNYNHKLDEWRKRHNGSRTVKVFYKASFLDNDEKERVENAGWKIFDLGEIARFFTPFISFEPSEIIRSYASHVIFRNKEATEVSTLPMSDWSYANWRAWVEKKLNPEILRSIPGLVLVPKVYQGHYFSVYASRKFKDDESQSVCMELMFGTGDATGIAGALHPRRDHFANKPLPRDAFVVSPEYRAQLLEIVGTRKSVPWSAFRPPRQNATERVGSLRNNIRINDAKTVFFDIVGVLEEFYAIFDSDAESLLKKCQRARQSCKNTGSPGGRPG